MLPSRSLSVRMCIGVGDGGAGGTCPLQKIRKKYFSGKSHVKFENFVNFLGKNHVKFGHFVNFSRLYFWAKMSCPPKVDRAPTLMCVCVSSVTLMHPAKATGRNEMPFGRNIRVVPSNIVRGRRDLWSEPPVRSDIAYRQITLALVCSTCHFSGVTPG